MGGLVRLVAVMMERLEFLIGKMEEIQELDRVSWVVMDVEHWIIFPFRPDWDSSVGALHRDGAPARRRGLLATRR